MDRLRHRISLFIAFATAACLVGVTLWSLHHPLAGPGATHYGVFLLLILLNLRQPFQRPLERATLLATGLGACSLVFTHWPVAQLAALDLAGCVLLACYLLRITVLTVPGDEERPE